MQTNQNKARLIVHPGSADFLSNKNDIIHVKPYSTVELARLYGESVKTFRKWIQLFENEIGCKRGRFYSVRQVKLIFAELDVPHVTLVA